MVCSIIDLKTMEALIVDFMKHSRICVTRCSTGWKKYIGFQLLILSYTTTPICALRFVLKMTGKHHTRLVGNNIQILFCLPFTTISTRNILMLAV